MKRCLPVGVRETQLIALIPTQLLQTKIYLLIEETVWNIQHSSLKISIENFDTSWNVVRGSHSSITSIINVEEKSKFFFQIQKVKILTQIKLHGSRINWFSLSKKKPILDGLAYNV